jgi:hypothetical protein
VPSLAFGAQTAPASHFFNPPSSAGQAAICAMPGPLKAGSKPIQDCVLMGLVGFIFSCMQTLLKEAEHHIKHYLMLTFNESSSQTYLPL